MKMSLFCGRCLTHHTVALWAFSARQEKPEKEWTETKIIDWKQSWDVLFHIQHTLVSKATHRWNLQSDHKEGRISPHAYVHNKKKNTKSNQITLTWLWVLGAHVEHSELGLQGGDGQLVHLDVLPVELLRDKDKRLVSLNQATTKKNCDTTQRQYTSNTFNDQYDCINLNKHWKRT